MATLNQDKKIAVTGGNGFLGTHVLKHSAFSKALAIGRNKPVNHHNFEKVSLEEKDGLVSVLKNINVVVHLAGRAHVLSETSKDPTAEYRRLNTDMSLNVARQAGISGVERFIFISTSKVHGDHSEPSQAFKYNDALNPPDPYSLSKAEAEEGLKLIGEEYNMDIVIIRPPLIYGQGVKGNFLTLQKLVTFRTPFPFASIDNKRSFVGVDNLVDLIAICLKHPKAKNKTFLVSDDEDMSTNQIIKLLAASGGFKYLTFSIPQNILYHGLKLLGKPHFYERLCASMQLDIKHTRSTLGWSPPFTTYECLKRCW